MLQYKQKWPLSVLSLSYSLSLSLSLNFIFYLLVGLFLCNVEMFVKQEQCSVGNISLDEAFTSVMTCLYQVSTECKVWDKKG